MYALNVSERNQLLVLLKFENDMDVENLEKFCREGKGHFAPLSPLN